MKINPISFQLNSNIHRNQDIVSIHSLKISDSYDTLSFGKKEKLTQGQQQYNFKKAYKEIKKLIDARDDFTPQDKKYLKWAIKYDHDAMKRNFLEKKSDSMYNTNHIQLSTFFISWFGQEDKLKWEKEEKEFEKQQKLLIEEEKKRLAKLKAEEEARKKKEEENGMKKEKKCRMK